MIFCHTPADPDVASLVGNQARTRTVCCPKGALIPHLWREGILIARGERIATTTAHCIPAVDWVDMLLTADLGQTAVLAGTIDNDPAADAKSCAIFLQRYAAFAPPQVKRKLHDPAADNALYRRSDLLRYSGLLRHGFWEPSFHQRFRAEGLCLALDPSLRVTHRNRYTARQYMRQRLAHGREFGITRAGGRSIPRRLLLILLAPGIFPLLLTRIVRRAFVNPALPRLFAVAWFWLLLFLLAWVAGEISGYLASLRPRQQ